MDSGRKLVVTLGRLISRTSLWGGGTILRATQSTWHWRNDSTGGDGYLDVLWRSRNELRRQIGNLDAFCFIVIAGRDYL